MAKKTAASAAKVTEFVIKSGKQGVFSDKSKSVCVGKLGALRSEAATQGTNKEFKLYERTVVYPDHTEVPTGEDSFHVKGEVTEKEIEA